MRFGPRFAAQRKKKKISVEETARMLGISRSYVVLIEGDKRRPSSKILPKIAALFAVPTNDILNWYLEDMREVLEAKIK